jgi:hypothetical protein
MNVGQIATGVGLGAYGVAFYLFSRWYVLSDARMRRGAESRWWLDQRTVRRVRRGQMMKDDWFELWIHEQRQIVKWIFTPFIGLWLVLCIVMVVNGLRSG